MTGSILSAQEYIAQFDVGEQLNAAPKTFAAPAFFNEPGLKELFYESVDYQGKPTRCFAWIGLPENAGVDHPVPGIVLIHGGGGTAFASWVRHWNSLGYAAIAMDTCGAMPCWSETPGWHPEWPRHDFSGVPGWGGFEKAVLPIKEQWPYHAVAAVLRATALLKACREVNADKIGIAGISWGGFLTLLTCSVAPADTYRFAIPVYASTHFTDFPSSTVDSDVVTAEQVTLWTKLWDPTPAFPYITVPTLFLTDAEDVAFALPAWQKTTEMPQEKFVTRSLRIHYSHDHETSMHSKTEAAFADAMLHRKKLPVWGVIQVDGPKLRSTLEMNGRRMVSLEMCFTRAEGYWGDRHWINVPAKVTGNQVEAELFRYTTAAFFTVTDDYGCIWTSPVFIDK